MFSLPTFSPVLFDRQTGAKGKKVNFFDRILCLVYISGNSLDGMAKNTSLKHTIVREVLLSLSPSRKTRKK